MSEPAKNSASPKETERNYVVLLSVDDDTATNASTIKVDEVYVVAAIVKAANPAAAMKAWVADAVEQYESPADVPRIAYVIPEPACHLKTWSPKATQFLVDVK